MGLCGVNESNTCSPILSGVPCSYCPSDSYLDPVNRTCIDINKGILCLDKKGLGSPLNSGKCISCPVLTCLNSD